MLAALAVPAYLLGGTLVVALLVVVAVKAIDALEDDGPTYGLAATRACLVERGFEVQYYAQGRSTPYPTLEVGPFGADGAPSGEPSVVLAFAPTPERAEESENIDSEHVPRKGNVLMPATPTSPIVEECLEASQTQ